MKQFQIFFVLTGIMMIWGFNVSAIKIIVEDFMPITITALRIFIAGCAVLSVLALAGKFRLPVRKEWKFITIGALFNVVGHHYFLAAGLTHTSAVNAGLILGLGPLLTALLSMMFLRKKPTLIRFSGFILGAAGVSVTILGNGSGLSGMSLGDLQIFLSIFSQAISFIIISQAVKSLDPRLLTGYMLIFGSAVLFMISLATEPGGLASLAEGSALSWSVMLSSAILATALGHMTYNVAISRVGAAEASIFINLSTFFSLLGAAIFLGDQIVSAHLLGLAFIITGVVLGSGAFEEIIRRTKQQPVRS
ncbi:EamA family transporter [Bacillus lacus]|uniref:EamA family transporter n=1 Tax=Metabacillus lacus TaxID=1983721 RepID=A0A7X2IZB3_9BACI|nr:DMT family transporter [Metabacillus lacus]MRX72446.1 EamA family transporter [Metabacillus lacus]